MLALVGYLRAISPTSPSSRRGRRDATFFKESYPSRPPAACRRRGLVYVAGAWLITQGMAPMLDDPAEYANALVGARICLPAQTALSAAGSVTGREAARRRSTHGNASHARAEVASTCRACGEPIVARRSTRRFCSGACRQRVHRADRRPMLAPIAHQRRIRDAEAARDPRPVRASLEGCAVAAIPFAEAKAIIVRYEWAQDHARRPKGGLWT